MPPSILLRVKVSQKLLASLHYIVCLGPLRCFGHEALACLLILVERQVAADGVYLVVEDLMLE